MTLESYISFLVNNEHDLMISRDNFLHHYHLYDLDTSKRINTFDILEYYPHRNHVSRRCFKYYEDEKYDVEYYHVYAQIREENYLRVIINSSIRGLYQYVYFKNNKQYVLPVNNIDEDKLKQFKAITNSYVVFNVLKGW